MTTSVRALIRQRVPALTLAFRHRDVEYLAFSHEDETRYRARAELETHNLRKQLAVEWLLADSSLSRPFTLLDVGCGPGGFARLLRDKSPGAVTYTGTDQSREAIEFCEREYPSEMTFVQRDVLSEGLPLGHYDVIVVNEVIEHMPNYKDLLDLVYSHQPKVFVLTTFAVIPGLKRDRRLWRRDTRCYMNSYAFGNLYSDLHRRTRGRIEMADLGSLTQEKFWFPAKAALVFYVSRDADG